MAYRTRSIDRIFHWPAQAAAGLIVSVVIAESLLALSLLFGAQEHLLWAVTRPAASATSVPAQLAVIWLLASLAGSSLAATLGGNMSAGLPAGVVPAASLALIGWYFRQPTSLISILMAGPLVGCVLGIIGARTLRRRDAKTASTHNAEI
ncbi:MAG: hypothetical protein V2J20_06755 [Wenzhouxiangella sp.]|jgi:hypothetical protein|nr:hypothetical protein [Wenzhouxiangella sp.]